MLPKGSQLLRKPDSPYGLRALWFSLTTFLLGPFALWFILTAKIRRRNLLENGLRRQLALCGGFLAYGAFLFFAPLHWGILLAIHILASGWTVWAMRRPNRSRFFELGFEGSTGTGDPDPLSPSRAERAEAIRFQALPQSLLAAALAIFPLVYIMALLHNIGELDNFSIHLPSDVYTEGLLWMIYASPLVGLAGLLTWRTRLKPGLRALIYFYAGVAAVLGWIMVWERLDVFLAAQFQGSSREALLFPSRIEERYRGAVKMIFYGSAFLMGVGYLVGAKRSSVFAKRTLFLGLPSLLLYANMLFALGDWNFYLSGLRERAFEDHRYSTYRLAARAELARTPDSHGAPYLLDEWAELEYQSGDRTRAAGLLRKLAGKCAGKPYFSKLRRRAERELAAMAKAGEPLSAGKSGGTATQLELPVIKSASYLDQEWYALLSAVAFLKPSWSDLDLKKKLLDLSNTVQLHLPRLDNVPELIPALRQLEIPVTTCFLDAARLRSALAQGKVPFLSLYGHWVPLSGYDPARDGFYYYSYGAPTSQDWLRNEDTDLFYHQGGQAFGGEAEKARTRAFKYSLQKFVPSVELIDHLLDIGGVGMILGDSVFVAAGEREAAFLVEQGDVYYQEHENYPEAAAAYRKAGGLFPCEQIDSRKIYLKRRYFEFASDTRDYQNLFYEYPPVWMEKLGPDKAGERAIVGKIMAGKLGTYLMMNWYSAPAPDTSAESRATMDTAVALFRELHRMDPFEPIYVDSLAGLLARRGDLKGSESLYVELTGLYPFGSESANYRLAWVKLKLGKIDEIPPLIARCKGYSEEARFLTMRGAVSMRKGRWRSAYATLSRSLKVDKSIAETHALLADLYKRRGDERNMQVHQRWQKRST